VVLKDVIFSRASRTLRDATQVVTFLSVCNKKNVGKDRKDNAFNAFLQAGLTDLDEIWHDGRSYGVAFPKKISVNFGPHFRGAHSPIEARPYTAR